MRAINGMYYLCRKIHKRLVVLWVINEGMGAATTDLFKLPKDISVFNIRNVGGILWKTIYYVLSHLPCFINDKEVVKMYSKKITFTIKNRFSKKFIVCDTCNSIIQDIECTIFLPIEEIENRYKRIIQDKGKYVAIHIRRTDNIKSRKYSKIELFKKQIEELIQSKKYDNIYIATDDIKLKINLQKEYFPYVFGQKLDNVKRDSVSGIKEAYIDLLCLANAETIYGSYWSSFSEMAATIGKGNLVVVK